MVSKWAVVSWIDPKNRNKGIYIFTYTILKFMSKVQDLPFTD